MGVHCRGDITARVCTDFCCDGRLPAVSVGAALFSKRRTAARISTVVVDSRLLAACCGASARLSDWCVAARISTALYRKFWLIATGSNANFNDGRFLAAGIDVAFLHWLELSARTSRVQRLGHRLLTNVIARNLVISWLLPAFISTSLFNGTWCAAARRSVVRGLVVFITARSAVRNVVTRLNVGSLFFFSLTSRLQRHNSSRRAARFRACVLGRCRGRPESIVTRAFATQAESILGGLLLRDTAAAADTSGIGRVRATRG